MKYKIVFWVIFGMLMLTSVWLRIGVPYDDLMGETVRFPSVDAYYHLAETDYTYDNWPETRKFNPLLTWPGGETVGQRPLNHWLMATIAKCGGVPVDIVGAYWPAVLGVLLLVPTLFIGWVVWNKWAGLIGVALLAVIQGEFLGRTSLGFCDHHALEVFLSTTTALFFILALKKHWVWSIGAGVFLGLHLLNWVGSPMLSIFILMFIAIQSIYNHMTNQSNRDLCLSSFVLFVISFLIFASYKPDDVIYMLFFECCLIVPIVIYGISRLTSRLRPFWYPVILILFGIGSYALLRFFVPATKLAVLELSGLFGLVGKVGYGLERTISEVQPLFFPYGEFTTSIAWGGYGLILIVGIIGLVLLGFKARKPEAIWMIVWSLGIIAVTLMQRRFGYYLAVNLCLLSGYLCWVIMMKIAWKKRSKKIAKKKGLPVEYLSKVVVVIGVFIILVSMVIPSFMISTKEAKHHPYAITPSWIEATQWLRDETPVYDEYDYSIISWWDYGYWIMRESDRPVICHPGGGSSDKSAKFFTAQTTEEADAIADVQKAKYIVIDFLMVTNKFYAMPILAEKENFTDDNYNNSMACRLYFSDDGIEGYREVFESTQLYKGHGQVKIYERYKSEKE